MKVHELPCSSLGCDQRVEQFAIDSEVIDDDLCGLEGGIQQQIGQARDDPSRHIAVVISERQHTDFEIGVPGQNEIGVTSSRTYGVVMREHRTYDCDARGSSRI